MAFLFEPEPQRGVIQPINYEISRIVANNPSVMTYHGTNTYLIDSNDGFTVIDPGPDDKGHIDDVVRATAGLISAILLTHTHADHLGATAALKAISQAPTYGYRVSADPTFCPDVLLEDGDMVRDMRAIYTPGHACDHLCFARREGTIFSGDHVMSWSSSIVSPPGGNMVDYFESLKLLLARNDQLLLPGHGPPLSEPRAHIQSLLDHRVVREQAILEALGEGAQSTWGLVDRLYASKTDPWLRRAAERNVTAHLLKLQSEGRVGRRGDKWEAFASS
jgi:glyoxylase-like metal-dependent hydrolase (beta-lactamase superfamily II)